VSDAKLLLVAVCALNHWSMAEMQAVYRLSEPECVQHLLRLDHSFHLKRNTGGLAGAQADRRVGKWTLRSLHSPQALSRPALVSTLFYCGYMLLNTTQPFLPLPCRQSDAHSGPRHEQHPGRDAGKAPWHWGCALHACKARWC